MSVAALDPTHAGRRPRGMSMDMGSPYLLPGELQNSRSSLHSMSRSLRDNGDPYRPITMMKSDLDSLRALRMANEKGSVHSAATSVQSSQENSALIANARPMSQSVPSRADSMSPQPPKPSGPVPSRQLKSTARATTSSRKTSLDNHLPDLSPNTAQPLDLANFIPPPPPPPPKDESPATRHPRSSSQSSGSVARPPRKDSMGGKRPLPSIVVPSRHPSDHVDTVPSLPSTQPASRRQSEYGIDPSMIHTGRHSLDEPTPAPVPVRALQAPQNVANRLSIVGFRPLPTDLPDDNPEQRANRIRSFYKEYFDDSKPHPQAQYMEPQYMDDYDAGYLADYTIYDPSSGGFVNASKPWAQPVGRRAMTPPPAGAMPGSPLAPHRRHMSTLSAGRLGPRGRAPAQPKKHLPPPSPLMSLPTPHMLRDDSGIFNSIDFAPPSSYRDRQAGRSNSPQSVRMPYSPSVSPHIPLATAYDELAPVPSPHLLRKSGTFTALDFAPPPRFKGQGTASDTGSIRSNRSNISARHQEAIRAGAYRVSRIPTDVVSTRDDIANQLKPRWDMRSGHNIMG